MDTGGSSSYGTRRREGKCEAYTVSVLRKCGMGKETGCEGKQSPNRTVREVARSEPRGYL